MVVAGLGDFVTVRHGRTALAAGVAAALLWACTMIEPDNRTREFLGSSFTVELHDIQGLFGGRNLLIDSSGRVLLLKAARPGNGHGLREARYVSLLVKAEIAELRYLLVTNDLADLEIEERPGIPDEARPEIVVRNAEGETLAAAAWESDLKIGPGEDGKSPKKRFQQIYNHCRKLEWTVTERSLPFHEGKYRGPDGWQKFVESAAGKYPIPRKDASKLSRKELLKILKTRYENPIVEGDGPIDPFPGFRTCLAYDREQQAEDPLIPGQWIITPLLMVFHHFEIDKALETVGYVPASEEEALQAAITMAGISSSGVHVIIDPQSEEVEFYRKASKLDFSLVEKPALTRKDGFYEVVLHGYAPPYKDWVHEQDEYLTRIFVRIGEGVYSVQASN